MNANSVYTADKDLVPDPIARAQDGSYQQRSFSSDNGIVDSLSCSIRNPSGGCSVSNARIFCRGGSCPTWGRCHNTFTLTLHMPPSEIQDTVLKLIGVVE